MASTIESYGQFDKYQELGFTGIGISILSSVFLSTGVCLQKLVQKNSVSDPFGRDFHKNRMYMTGVLYVGVGYILRFILYGLLPLSTSAPLSSLTVVVSIILDNLILKEESKQITIISSVLIIIGAVICILSCNIADENYSIQALQSLFLVRFNFIMTVTLSASILSCKELLRQSAFFSTTVTPNENGSSGINDNYVDDNNDNIYDESNVYDRGNYQSNYHNNENNDDDDYDDFGKNNAYHNDYNEHKNNKGNNYTKNKSQNENSNRNNNNSKNTNKNDYSTRNTESDNMMAHSTNTPINSFYYNYNKVEEGNLFLSYLGFFYLVSANAIFSGWFSVSSKALIEIVKYSILTNTKKNHFISPGVIIILFLIPFCSTIKLKYTWYALSIYSPLQYIPLYQSGSILVNSIFGLVYFQDFSVRRIVGSQVFPGLYFVGLFCICVPMAMLSFRYNPQQHFPSSTAIESVEEENQTLLHENGNRNEESYYQKHGNSQRGNFHNSRKNETRNNSMEEEKNNLNSHVNNGDKKRAYQDGHKNGHYSNSPIRGYGAGDILIKSSDRNSGNGIKIPSKNPYNSPDTNNRNEKNVKLGNDHSRSVFGFLPSNFLPSSPAKLNVSFSGIACGGNGVEELMDGKGAPSALYVGSLQGINNLPLSASEDEKEGV